MSTHRFTETNFVALDLEATGVAFGHDRIVEIGAVRFRLDRDGHVIPGERFHRLVNPGMPLPELITRLTGLENASLVDAPPLEALWDDFTSFLSDSVVLAHQARADLSWLAAEALRLERQPLEIPFYCTLHLARRCVPGAPKYSLQSLVSHCGLKPGDHHRALADALHTRNLFAHCVGRSGAKDFHDFGHIGPEGWPEPREFEVRIPVHLAGLSELIASQEAVSIRYRGGSHGTAWRPITPLGFFASNGVPYLRAWCHLADDGRSFRCDRIGPWHAGASTTGDAPAAGRVGRRS